jgi:uncharacterized protein involved in exopolysaccharide biosynthesis
MVTDQRTDEERSPRVTQGAPGGVVSEAYAFAPSTGGPSSGSGGRAFDALRSRPLLVIAVVLVFVLLALGAGLAHKPSYQAESRLLVGSAQTVDTQALQSFEIATEQLAATGSRLISSDQVQSEITRKLNVSSPIVQASPIPQTAIIRVTATASSESAAVRLASVAAASLANVITNTGTDTAGILTAYQQASAEYAKTLVTRDQQQAAVNQAVAAGKSAATISALQETLSRTQGQVAADNLKANTLQTTYSASQRGALTVVQVVEAARSIGNDRIKVLERDGVIGLFLGLIVAAALASFLLRRRGGRAPMRARLHPTQRG